MKIDAVEFARLEEDRQAAGCAAVSLLTDLPGTVVEELAGGNMVYGGEGCFWNQACAVGMHGPVSEKDLDRLIEFYRDRDAVPRLEVTTLAEESFVEMLAKRGFVGVEFEHVFVRALASGEPIAGAGVVPRVAGMTIERIAEEHVDSELWARTAGDGFRAEGATDTDIASGLGMLRHPGTGAFLVRIDGEPAAAGSMEVSDPIACLFGMTTLEPYRRRGLQLNLIAHRLEYGRDHGCTVGCVHARPGIPTERNARRLGFELAYAKVIMELRA